ncbi:AAA family ATPase [Ciceribacter sp. L1K23]|uniref:AAA family ATPase n=1 Tax=Ciceribacter sp. L1K23 TaxID=2820276 RepID=UPI002013B1B7|nr:AAA family ATPase [Ciceribacter sp. L1K23]
MRGSWIVDKLVAHCTVIRGITPEVLRNDTVRRSRRSREDAFDLEETGLHLEITANLNNSLADDPEPSLFDPEEKILYRDVFLWPSSGLTQRQRSAPRLRKVLLAPYSHRNQPLLLKSISRLTQLGFKDRLVDLLKSIDNDLRDLDIITSEPFYRPTLLVERKGAGFVPISVLGDGFRRALSIALAMVEARSGVLLIDEIETAFHVSVLDQVFPWMVEIARELDVQIVATTHSLEAIQAMSSDRTGVGALSLAAFHLSSDGPGLHSSKRYSLDMLGRLVRDRGLDIR